MSVLGIYKRDQFNKTFRIGTPDASKYHDARSVKLEGANEAPVGSKLPGNEKFRLPGVVIPHARREGGSMGWNSETPIKVFIDPEQTGGQIVVDLKKVRANPGAFEAAINEAFSSNVEQEDAIVESFAKFSEIGNKPKQAKQEKEAAYEEQREAPLQMRGTYVVPRASPGGSQMKPASFGRKPEVERNIKQSSEMQTKQAVKEKPPVMTLDETLENQAVDRARSLHEELAGPQANYPPYDNPGRKVTFELPSIGQQSGSLGQFVCFYSHVIRDDMNLVLIYDHSRPSQMTWFPPVLENPDTGEPLRIAVLVHGLPGEDDILYGAYPTGIKFKYGNEEFYVMTYDREKVLPR